MQVRWTACRRYVCGVTVAGAWGSRLEQFGDQGFGDLAGGEFGVAELGFEGVAQGHELIDFGDDALLFGEWG